MSRYYRSDRGSRQEIRFRESDPNAEPLEGELFINDDKLVVRLDGENHIVAPPEAAGTQGPQGNQGPIGPQGSTGATGAQGSTGDPGVQGPMGYQGPQGFTGAQGAMGFQGPEGPQGSTGAQGVQGPTGATGEGNFTVEELTTSGTWTKPAGAKLVTVICIGAGGGGGSGQRSSTGGVRSGGGGGAAGGVSSAVFLASTLPSTVSYTVGLGGAGGAIQISNTTGITGSIGGNSSFGNYIFAKGGNQGRGGGSGTSTFILGGAVNGILTFSNVDCYYPNTTGDGTQSSSTSSGINAPNIQLGPSGGGSGGGNPSGTQIVQDGGDGGGLDPIIVTGNTNVNGGINTGPNFSGGNGPTYTYSYLKFGLGGGGGCNNIGVASNDGYPGGDGGYPGGGGGGGGSAVSGDSGAGGSGGNGAIFILTQF